MPKERSRRWQLTENNPSYTKSECMNTLASIGATNYIICCSETGESGTEHVHGFVIFENAIALKTLKKHFPRAHFEACIGSNIENREYVCKSDKDFVESGDMPIATRSERKIDLASEVVALLSKGEPLRRIMMEYPELCDYVVRNYRSLKEIERDMR